MDIDKINAALKVRDERLAAAHAKHNKRVVELNDSFAKEQQALAAGFAAEEQKSGEEANAEINSAIEDFDKALQQMAEEDMKNLVAVTGKTTNPDTPPAPLKTAAQLAKEFPSAVLKAKAKEMGLVSTGTELVVAQRLIEAGWVG